MQLEKGAENGKRNKAADKEISLIIYYTAFALYSVMVFVGRTTLLGPPDVSRDSFNDCVQLFVLALLAAKYFSQRMTAKQWVQSITIVCIGFISWRFSHEGWLFWLTLFLVCSQGVEIRTLAKITLGITVLLMLLTVSLSALAIISNITSMRGGSVREAMGFTHPNQFGMYLLLICDSFAIVRYEKSIIPTVFCVLLTTVINVLLADSRSSAMLSIILVFLLIVFRCARDSRSQRVLSWLCIAGVIVAVVGSYYFMVAYNPLNTVHAALNSALSGRLGLAHSYYLMQPLTLFGSNFSKFDPIYWENGKPYEFVVDNAFCHLVLRYGIVPTALFYLGLFGLFAKLLHQRRCDWLLFGLTLMMIYGTMETLGIRIECDFFLAAMGTELLFTDDKMGIDQSISRRHNRGVGLVGVTR